MTNFPPGAAKPRSRQAIIDAAAMVPCHPAMIAALVDVEAAGSGFWSDGRLKTLPEPHILNRVLTGPDKADALRKGLSRTSWDKSVYNAFLRTPADRYAYLDKVAGLYGPENAADAASWGAGQILGINAEKSGYASAMAMYAAFADDEDEQIKAIVMFCLRSGLRDELQREDTKGIARVYNGPGQVAHYAGEIDKALARRKREKWPVKATKTVAAAPREKNWLGIGDHGDEVKAVQRELSRLGYLVQIDGDFGPTTKKAVLMFQADRGLKIDGLVGKDTMAELVAAKPVPTLVTDPETGKQDLAPRQKATGDDLLKAGSTTVWRARLLKLVNGIQGAFASLFAGGVTVNALLDTGQQVKSNVDQADGLLSWILPESAGAWIGVALGAVALVSLVSIVTANRMERTRVEEHRSGKVATIGNGEVSA